jgi:cupin fold WbuC family metalloprotein
MNLDMRNSDEDLSQRMLNALEPNSVLPIHRHQNSSETLIVLRGAVKQCFYDDFGNLVESFILRPNSDSVGISTPIGQWHNTIALESGTIIFEAKDGAYQPLTSEDILDK